MNDYQNDSENVVIKESKDYKLVFVFIVLIAIIAFVVFAIVSKPNTDMTSSDSDTIIGSNNPDAGWPSDMPPPPPPKPSVTINTDMTAKEALTYHQEEIVAKGGTVSEVLKMGNKDIIVAETASKESYVVYVEEIEGKAVVTVVSDVKL